MLDTVWMKLRAIRLNEEHTKLSIAEEHIMFGPTGITHFKESEKHSGTDLFNSSGKLVISVEEEQEIIFGLIAKIRGTGDREKKKVKGKTRSKKTKTR